VSSGYRWGVAAVLLAALCASSAGIIVRHVEVADAWQILFYRALAFTGMLFAMVLARHGRATGAAFRAIGWPGLVLAVALGTAFIAFIFALTLTTVANTVFILGASPLAAALLGRLVLGEGISAATLMAMVGALIGVALMVGDSLGSGSLDGNLAALIACLGYAVAVVSLRAGRAVDMMPATCLSGVFALLVCSLLVGSLAIPTTDILLALLLGSGQLGAQYALITYASRFVPAGQIALIMLLEVLVAPLWVWIGVGEVPADMTLLGGFVVLAALLLQMAGSLKRAPA